MEFLQIIIYYSLLNVGLVLMLDKFGAIEHYSLHKRRWMPSCNFCLFFWMTIAELIRDTGFKIGFKEYATVFCAALAAAALSRKLL